MRFDGKKYRDCRWCRGAGCLYCESEANKAYRREFPEGPQPTISISLDELPKVREALTPDAMRKAFGPGGGGMQEIVNNVAKLRQQQS